MKMDHTDRSHYSVTRQSSQVKLRQCAQNHRSPSLVGRLQWACCTRCSFVRETAVLIRNAILLRKDVRCDCVLHRSTTLAVVIFRRRVHAASTLRELRRLQRLAEPEDSRWDAE